MGGCTVMTLNNITTTYDPVTGNFYKGEVKDFKHATDPIATLTGKKMSIDPSMNTAYKIKTGTLTAATIGTAQNENLTHLQEIELLRDVIGTPVPNFFAEEAFRDYTVDNLRLRVPYIGEESRVERLGPNEPSSDHVQSYGEAEFNVTKLVTKVYRPIEDSLKTQINPLTIESARLAYEIKKQRNADAIAVLQTIKNSETGSSSITNLGNIRELGTGGVHSKVNVASVIADSAAKFHNENKVPINTIVGNIDFISAFTDNTWTNPNTLFNVDPSRPTSGTVQPLLSSLPGITSITDNYLPNGSIYLLNKESALARGEGPKMTRTYYDEVRDGNAIKMIDFVEFKNASDAQKAETGRFYAYKMTYSTS